MTTSGTTATRGATLGMTQAMIPDGMIKLYFGLFPILVATFLSVQAVRAHTAQDTLVIPANYPVMGIAR